VLEYGLFFTIFIIIHFMQNTLSEFKIDSVHGYKFISI
jgi:hypothetical protein